MQRECKAQHIMETYASSTGLSDPLLEPRRYLWTDAFAVCNFLALYQHTDREHFLHQALKLVEQVHEVLGQHRKNSSYGGWLSGLTGEQARLHPARGGLRIGKPLAERRAGEPADNALEWQQDGQYFHYLLKGVIRHSPRR